MLRQNDVRVVVTRPDGRVTRLIVPADGVFTVCGRTVVRVAKGFQIYPLGTVVKVYRA